jgi:hypothetical protein
MEVKTSRQLRFPPFRLAASLDDADLHRSFLAQPAVQAVRYAARLCLTPAKIPFASQESQRPREKPG